MRFTSVIGTLALLLSCCVTQSAQATLVVPTYTTFGSLPAANFNGTGIPNDAVAITTITDGANTITLGLTATPRFAAPAVTNNGAGDFFAQAGNNGGAPPRSLWNFNYYMNISGGGTFADYSFKLLYDLDSAAANDDSTLGTFDFNALIALGGSGALGNTTTYQDSQNSTFSFLNTSTPPVITPPSPAVSFDPNALGEYTFSLQAFSGSTLLGQSAIRVNAIPEPTAFLFGGLVCGVIGLAAGGRRLLGKLQKQDAV